MKASELRIGNCAQQFLGVSDNGAEYKEIIIEANDIYRISGLNHHDIEPIFLTEQWLIKFGFANYENQSWFWSFDFDDKQETFKIFPLTAGGEPMGLWGIVGCPQLVKKIEFVHQLQNLYFALTTEELILNE